MAQSTTNLGKIHVFPSETLYNQFKDIIADNDLALLKDDGAYIVAALLEQNGYVKFSNGLILQWGACNTENYHAFPITFGTVFSLVALPNYNTNRYQNLVCTALDSYGFTVSMSWGTSVPALFFAIGND